MRTAALLAVIAAATGAAGAVLQGPLPGDAGLTLALQAVLGTGGGWAGLLTATGKAPLVWGTLALGAALAWQVAGWRGGLAVPTAYAFAFAADKAARAVLFVPRPDPALVAVADHAASSGLPSTFGLAYGAIFGTALLARGSARGANLARFIAALILIAGATARITAGGHWSSQMLASTACGLLLSLAALEITGRLRLPHLSRG